MAISKRQQLQILKAELDNERSSFIAHWRELGEYIFPRRPRFHTSDINKGDKRNSKIIDSTATLAARTLRSGLMGGVTSPARPWFRLTTPEPDTAEKEEIKSWLHHVNQRMLTVFLRSNLYNILPIVYGDIGVFGTSAVFMQEDFQDVVRFYSIPIGSYMIGVNERGSVDVFFREFRMTVRQIVEKYGRDEKGRINWDNISDYVKQQWDIHKYETWIEVNHVVRPNPEWDPNLISSKYKKYQSCYYETGSTGKNSNNYLNNQDDKFLRESGYDLFPVLCPRWETTGEDVYGTKCPAMDALGDIKQLQLQEKRIAQAVEKIVNPPMTGPTSLRQQKASILPGDITYVDGTREGGGGFRTAHEVNIRINDIEDKQQQIRQRISRCFYEDLFLMLAQIDRKQITATEIAERKEEKLLALGPMLEQLNQDLLDPLIDKTFEIMLRQDMIPTPPDELQGEDLKVEYISIMAQAQKLVGISAIERFTGFISGVAQVQPEVLDKVNSDQLIDTYGDITSVPPDVIRPDEEVQQIRDARQQQIQQQQQVEQIATGAGAVKDLADAKTGEESALSQVLTQ